MPVVDPLVSVVVPSWNKGRFLRPCLESLLRQTYPHVEIIVQDNCSTDETPDLLANYGPRLSQVVCEPDEGQSDALHRGFERARGDILAWLNADDLLMPDAIERAVAAFQQDATRDVVYGHCALVDEDGQFLRYFHEVQPFSAALLQNRLNYIAQPSTFFTRRAYEAIGGIDRALHYVMDWDLWCRFARGGHAFHFLDHVLSAARTYPETKTSGGGLDRLQEIFRLNQRYKTTRWPLAALAHAYHDFIASRRPQVHAFLRRLWQMITGQRFMTPSIVQGLGFPDRIAASAARIHFPYFGPLAGVTLTLHHPPEAPALRATLAGLAGTPQRRAEGTTFTWIFDPSQYFTAIDLEIQLNRGSPAADMRVRQVALHTAPLPAAPFRATPSSWSQPEQTQSIE